MTDVDVFNPALVDEPDTAMATPRALRPVSPLEAVAPAPSTKPDIEEVVAEARELGLNRVQILAWRDFEDPEAGGSELHAHRVATIWAEHGLDVTLRSSAVEGLDTVSTRSGYRVIRKSGRYSVFPRSALSGLLGRGGRPDGLVEVWNGMPFFSPLWARCPRIVVVHHVHADMWKMVLTPTLAKIGEAIELRIAPPIYRRSRVVTLSPSSHDDLVSMFGLDPERIDIACVGVDERFVPGGHRSKDPLVVAVGRLVPVKRFELLVDSLVDTRRFVPNLRAVIVGEGYEREKLEEHIRAAGATDWISLPGHLTDEELVATYRRAWVVASTSLREGWNMTLSEAGACGTPSVATNVVGHKDSVRHEVTGLLAEPGNDFAAAMVRVLTDEVLRGRLGRGALNRARELTWEATAANVLAALVAEARARRRG
ncbi:MAG TPA: glycosyltransferase family 4 protein [Acidimicrobiales bacterium]|nr:glycosyltransferase family 4 protein [Acidimicrobiales bacterium]